MHQLEENLSATKKSTALLEAQIRKITREKDDAHFKLQQSLDAAKDEISHGFVDGFSGTLEQFRALYLDLDQSKFVPFKVFVDGKKVEE